MGWLTSTNRYTSVEPRIKGVRLSMEEKVRLARMDTMNEARAVRRNKMKIKRALVSQYRRGLIDSDTFLQLAARMEEITDDLMTMGNTTGVVLGKKYVCGSLDKDDFEKIKCDLVPASREDEEQYVHALFAKRKARLTAFREHLTGDLNVCQKCHRDSNFLSPLRELDEMILCKSCLEYYERNKYFTGFEGVYISCDPCEIDMDTEPTCHPVAS